MKIEYNRPKSDRHLENRMKMYAELKRKKCAVCKNEKDFGLFYKDKRRSFGLARECKVCKEAETKRRRKANPELFKIKRKRASLKEKFEMTIQQWHDLFTSQKECCAICEGHQSQFKRSLAVDHDHETGIIRGLLCDNCNNGLGRFKDNPKLILKASEYLNKFKN